LKTTLKNCGTKLNIIFPPFQHNSESSAEPENLILREEEELCELQSDRILKMRFTDLSLDKFWISVPFHSQGNNKHTAAVFNFLHV
jgi:hypothetical protein